MRGIGRKGEISSGYGPLSAYTSALSSRPRCGPGSWLVGYYLLFAGR